MYLQKYERLYFYIHEYQKMLYEVYSNHVVAFLTTYYHIDKEETIWEDEKVFGGPYHDIGDLSGIKWEKILLLPVYYSDEISTAFDGQDIGYIKDNVSSFTIPSTYGFTPYPGDMIKLEQEFLRPTNDIYPVFRVEGVEIFPNTDRRFWKLNVKNFQSRTTDELDQSVSRILSFTEYDKKIHLLEDAQCINRILVKHSELKDSLSAIFDDNSGFYFV
jgi:hypothetical protein